MAIENFEDIFVHIGGFGRYQMSLFAVECLLNIFGASVYYSQFFMSLTPPHWCHPPPEVLSLGLTEEEVMRLTLPPMVESSTGYQSCATYIANFTEIVLQNGSWPDPSWPTTSCSYGWIYNYSSYYPTITSQLNWVCDEDWKPPLAQSLYLLGSAFGSPLFGWAADIWGRLPLIVFTNVLGAVAGTASAFCPSFWIYSALRFIVGMTHDQHYMIGFILLAEYVGNDYRTITANLPSTLMTIMTCVMPFLALGIGNWSVFCIAVHAPQIVSLFFICFVPESARWMISKGNVKETIEVLIKAAVVNGKNLSPSVIEEFKIFGDKQAALAVKEGKVSTLDLLKTPVLRKRFLVLASITMVSTMVYDVYIRNTENLGYDVFISFALAGAMEIPADLLSTLSMAWVGRRYTACFSLSVCGISSLSILLISKGNITGLLIITLICNAMSTVAMNVQDQFTLEVLPTVARGQGNGMINTLGFLAALASPYLVYLTKYNMVYPYLVTGIMTVSAGVLCLLLPETLKENLPNTLEDGETYFVGQPFCYNPCVRKTSVRSRKVSSNVGIENGAFEGEET